MSESDRALVTVEQDGIVLEGGPGSDLSAMTSAIEQTAPDSTPVTSADDDHATTPVPDAAAIRQKEPRGRERFSQLTAEREAARTEAAEATKRAIALEDRLKALETRTASPPPAPVQEQPQQQPQTPEQQLEARIRAEVQRAYQQEAEVRALNDRMSTIRTSARDTYPDFDTMLSTGPGAQIELAADSRTAEERVNMLIHTDGGQHVLYTIAKDAALAQRLSKMSDREFGFTIARLLPADGSVASPASTAAPRAVSAPPPYQPVGAGGKTTAPTLEETTKRATTNGAIDFDQVRDTLSRQRQGGRRR